MGSEIYARIQNIAHRGNVRSSRFSQYRFRMPIPPIKSMHGEERSKYIQTKQFRDLILSQCLPVDKNRSMVSIAKFLFGRIHTFDILIDCRIAITVADNLPFVFE